MTARIVLQSLIVYGMKSDVRINHVESRIQGHEAIPSWDYFFLIKSCAALSYSATSIVT
jgi:hypothetical protein